MHVLITGGSGFIGSRLTTELLRRGHRVTNLDRVPSRITNRAYTTIITDLTVLGEPDAVAAVQSAEAIIHLAGASIFNRWTDQYKKIILESRVQPAVRMASMIKAVPENARVLRVYVSASAIGYYGDHGDEVVSELGTQGNDFLAQVCGAWEASRDSFEAMGVRTVSVRTAIVLGPGGGMMSKLVPLFKWGLGGVLGNGEQWFSWIHIDDLVAIYTDAITAPDLRGPVNAAAPDPVTNRQFTKALSQVIGRPAWFRIPGWVLRVALGPFAGAILMSQRVVPNRLRSRGFTFAYGHISAALKSVL